MFVYSAKKVRIKRVKILFKSKYTVSTDITTKILKEGELERQNTKKRYITPENKNCIHLTVTFKGIRLSYASNKQRKKNELKSNSGMNRNIV